MSDAEAEWGWDESQGAPDWVPPTVDITVPSAARIYDYLLGGKDNFAIDREAAAKLLGTIPDAQAAARANRAFLREVVPRMARDGITQFLDLGTGIPTQPNVHDLARSVHPDSTVVYVDMDPIVIAHDTALLASEQGVFAVQHDLRDPAAVLEDPAVRDHLDFSRPIGLVMVAVLHFVEIRQAPMIMSHYVQALPAGSQVAITVGCRDGVDDEAMVGVQAAYARAASQAVGRTTAQIEELFDGLELLPPGLQDCYRSPRARILSGVGVKPGA